MPGARMDESNRSFRAAARCRVDELHTVDLQPQQCLREIRDLEADVVEAFALRRKKPGDAGRIVGGLDKLDLRFAHTQERDAHLVRRNRLDRLELEAHQPPIEIERPIDRFDDERDVMNPAQARQALGLIRRPGDGSRFRHSPQRTLPPCHAATARAR